jgi:PHP family Zn ribbon phosphoesterase
VIRTPDEIRKHGIVCPVCNKRLTEGVFIRLQQLSGKEVFDEPIKKENDQGLVWFVDPKKQQPPYVKLVPLLEIVAESMGSTVQSQKTKNLYFLLLKTFGTEFDVILKTPIDAIATTVNEKVAMGIAKVRKGDISIHPGYDGEYGIVKIWDEKGGESDKASPQLSLGL